jgi:hypothetical protein
VGNGTRADTSSALCIGRYVIKNAFPADQIGNGRSDNEI